MSSTNRGGQRSDADNYPTPAWCVRRLLEVCPLPPGRWLEPAAGEGAIIKAVNEKCLGITWTALDIRNCGTATLDAVNGSSSAAFHHVEDVVDFLCWEPDWESSPARKRFDVCITNPPYSQAGDFIRRSLELADVVVMLLRLNFLGSESRADFWRAHPPDVFVLPNRPAFINGKTDSCEYAWFVWRSGEQRSAGSIRVLATTPKDERRST